MVREYGRVLWPFSPCKLVEKEFNSVNFHCFTPEWILQVQNQARVWIDQVGLLLALSFDTGLAVCMCVCVCVCVCGFIFVRSIASLFNRYCTLAAVAPFSYRIHVPLRLFVP